MNRFSSIFAPDEYGELNTRKSFSRFGGKCPTCNDTGEYIFDGKIRECEKDYDGICIQKKLFMRYELANIPHLYQRFDWDIFDTQPEAREKIEKYTEKLEDAIKSGLGLYIYSHGLGTGKTLIGTYVLKEAVKRGYKAYFCPFFELVNIHIENRDTIEKKLIECDIVCIDDVTAGRISEKQSDLFKYVLEKVIRDRVHNSMPTIVTSNLGKSELMRDYDRVFSLLMSSCFTLELDSSFDFRIEGMQPSLDDILRENIAPIT